MKHLLLLARTLQNLKPSQVFFYFVRRYLPKVPLTLTRQQTRTRRGVHIGPSLINTSSVAGQYEFHFLNISKAFPDGQIDWHPEDVSRLWKYNFHCFDYLLDPGRSKNTLCQMMSHWIKKNPVGTETAWEPYTVSLRIVNWIKLFLSDDFRNSVRQEWLDSLYFQAMWLERNIEYHILANHYLKNGVAMYFAGTFFEGEDADRWLHIGKKILQEEIEEQFLGDGGHFERSPMYHIICVEDYLDVLNLAQANDLEETGRLADFKARVARSLDFLNDIRLPDGEIPLFNDSAFGIAPSPEQLFEYAKRVIGYRRPPRPEGIALIEKGPTGYFGVRHNDDMLIVDCGPIGPDYQPGHAHCDTLSYELVIDGRRVIVDSGVHDYEEGRRRQYARSTRAHNTVVVDDEEQSEIWGLFRVARRAYPLDPLIRREDNGFVRFEGAHDGYRRLKGKVIHRRKISYDGAQCWEVSDTVTGKGQHFVESFIHLHPDYGAIVEGHSINVVEGDRGCQNDAADLPDASYGVGEVVLGIEAIDEATIRLDKGSYFPEFGVDLENDVIILSLSGQLPIHLMYRLRKLKTTLS